MYREDNAQVLENASKTLVQSYRARNFGRYMVKIVDLLNPNSDKAFYRESTGKSPVWPLRRGFRYAERSQ